MSIVGLACTEQRIQGVVSWNKESGEVHKEFTSDVEEDEEEVDRNEAKESVDFGDGGLLLEVVERGISGELQSHESVKVIDRASEGLAMLGKAINESFE